MTDTLADHIRDAAANLKAGIEKLKPLTEQALLANGCRCATRDRMPPEIHKAMHALSYAVKAVEAQSSVDHQQRRGVAWDIIDEAIVAYDQWMLDDDYQPGKVMANIISQMRERRNLYTVQAADAKAEPVGWRYGRKDWNRKIWRVVTETPTFETPDDWIVEPLFAAPPAVDRAAVIEALEKCRTSYCGYAITNPDQYPEVLASFWKELQRIDGIARAALADAKGDGK
jgi:hypothetical protein